MQQELIRAKTAEGTRLQMISSADKTNAVVVSTLMEAWEVVNAGLFKDSTVKDVSSLLTNCPHWNLMPEPDSVWSACWPQQNCRFSEPVGCNRGGRGYRPIISRSSGSNSTAGEIRESQREAQEVVGIRQD